MKFLNPGWLWGILALPLFYLIALLDDRRKRGKFELFANNRVWETIAPEYDPGAKLRKTAVLLLSAFFLLLALARPQWGMHEEVAHVSGLDVMIVLDVSNSMQTEDVVPSRLQKAKHLIRTLADRLEGDRVGLIGFAGGASVACPLTTDLNYLLETAQIMSPKLMPSQGTDIGVGLDTAVRALDRGSEDEATSGESGPPSRAIILITDGEDHEGKGEEIAQKIKKQGIKLYVLGVGTQKGGPVPMRDENGNLSGYKKDRRGQPVISTFRPAELMQLAAGAGGRYWNVTTDESEAGELLQDLGAMNRNEYSERRFMVFEDRFQWPLAIAILLYLLELCLPARKLRVQRSSRLTKVVAKKLFPATLILLLPLSSSRASPIETYIENKKGVDAYDKGQIDEAKQDFGKAQALDPSRPELQYNQGLIQLQEGKMDEAMKSFEDSASKSTGKDADLAARSLYNMGVAAAKKGDTKAAVKSYLDAINEGRKLKDGQIEQAARKNLELLVKQEQQKKQQQKQTQDQQQKQNQNQKQQQNQNQQQQQNQQDQQQQSKNEQQKDDKNGDQQKNQPQQYRQDAKQKFESKKLGPEDAERVISELSNREKELQKRLKAGNGRAQDNPQDW